MSAPHISSFAPLLLSPSRRVQTSARPSLRDTIEGHANNFTLIRLILAGSVIFFHAFWLVEQRGSVDDVSRLLHPMTSLGAMAVACFFFLSGLFVTQSFHRDQSVVLFSIRRAARIWPGLFVCVLATTIVAAIASRGTDAWHFLQQASFYDYISHNARLKVEYFVPGVYESTRTRGLNGSLHTLPVEVMLYAMVAVAGLLGLLRRTLWITATAATLLGIALVHPAAFTDSLGVHRDGRLPIALFFAGCLSYGLSARIRIAGWQFVPLALATWASEGGLHTFAFFSTAIWTMLYIGQWPALSGGLRMRRDISFGTYIYGYPVQQLIVSLWPDIGPYMLTLLAVPLAMLLGLLSWQWIEAPGIAFGRQCAGRWQRRRGARAQQPAQAAPRAMPAAADRWSREARLVAVLIVAYFAITFMGEWLRRNPV